MPKSPSARAARRRTRAEESCIDFTSAATRFAGDTGNSASATTASSRTCAFGLLLRFEQDVEGDPGLGVRQAVDEDREHQLVHDLGRELFHDGWAS